MTTEQLRKVIEVTNWMLGEKGLSISYTRTDQQPYSRHLILNHKSAIEELSKVGTIEDYIIHEDITQSSIQMDDQWHSFAKFLEIYQLCQWEALSIVLHHEAEKELINDIGTIGSIWL